MAQRQKESQERINGLYDQQYNSQAAQLKTAYDRNLSNAQAEQAKIAPQYQTQANQLAVQYERNRRNANMNAMNSGLNTGTALQQQDAMNNVWQKNYANLRGNEMAAQAEAGQKIADLGADYQGQLASARATAENSKAAALIDEQNKLNEWYDAQAKQLAKYGDFSAYESLYGKTAAKQMKQIWVIQNPDAALSAKMITKKKYRQITGHDPGQK